MRRQWRWVAAIVALVLGVASVAFADDWYNGYRVVSLFLDGNRVRSDVPPIIMDGRTLLPVRFLAESMGTDVGWNQETWTVTLTSQPRLDFAQSATGLQMSLVGVQQLAGDESSTAGRGIGTVRIVNRGTGEQAVDLSHIQLVGQDGRTRVAPIVLETRGSKRPAPGTTTVILAPGEEITAELAYDITPTDGSSVGTYRMVMFNDAGEPVMALRVKITITIDCSHRPCTWTITISF
ncbi:MAG TPA: copper amine oxidase N-terminal domain-containing protein [Symbiobacteriaceae bacterium]|nr:copper amine oxidase N-terminal domain-containing protein [Symbiobacteriaceae bacterium]